MDEFIIFVNINHENKFHLRMFFTVRPLQIDLLFLVNWLVGFLGIFKESLPQRGKWLKNNPSSKKSTGHGLIKEGKNYYKEHPETSLSWFSNKRPLPLKAHDTHDQDVNNLSIICPFSETISIEICRVQKSQLLGFYLCLVCLKSIIYKIALYFIE